jgi:hypothetical protein
MRLRLQRQPLAGPDPERRFACLVATGFAAVAAMVLLWPRAWLPPCLFHRLTGFPCPTCGLVRSLRLLLAGHLREAWLQQPLAVTACLAAAAGMVYAVLVVWLRLPRLRVDPSRRVRRGALILLAAAVLANWIYLIIRGV